jgi:hypothetical protein
MSFCFTTVMESSLHRPRSASLKPCLTNTNCGEAAAVLAEDDNGALEEAVVSFIASLAARSAHQGLGNHVMSLR